MNNSVASSPNSNKSSRYSRLPGILVIILLLFLIPISFIFARWLLDQCIAGIQQTKIAPVLGISNLSVDAGIDQVQSGDVVNFTVKGNNTGPLSNGVVTFSTIGQGKITSAPVGSGLCVVVSQNQATCTGVNLLSNEQLNYVVPVVVDAVCGLTGGDIVGLNVDVNDTLTQSPQDANASANVECTNAEATTTPTPTMTLMPTTTVGSDNDNTGTPASGEVTTQNSASYDKQLAACYDNYNNALMLSFGLSLLLILIVFIVSTLATRRHR